MTLMRSARPNRNRMSCSMITMRQRALQFRDELGEARGAVRAESGRRLVEEQDARLGGERQADLQRAPLAVGEVACANPFAPAQADAREHRRRLVLRAAIARPVAPGVERPRAASAAARRARCRAPNRR